MQKALGNSLVLFNIGDTLIEAPKQVEELAFAEVFNKVFGVDASIHSIRYHGKTSQQIILEVMKKNGFDGREDEVLAKMEECKRVMCSYWSVRINKDDIQPKPGAKKILSSLAREGFVLGVVTGNFYEIARAKLNYAGLTNLFLVIAFGEDARERKALLEQAVKRALNYGYVYYFGDTPHDMAAGYRLKGVIPIGVATGDFDITQLHRAGAEYTLPSLSVKNVMEFVGLKKRKAVAQAG